MAAATKRLGESMNYKILRRNIGHPIRLCALRSNATLPFSDWIIRSVNRRGQSVQIDNPATGYRLYFGPAEIYGFDEDSQALALRVGLYFDCPNVLFLYSKSR